MLTVRVQEPTHAAEARRLTVGRARAAGLSQDEAVRAGLVATELATNLLKHAGGGELLIGGGAEADGGLACIAIDRGPGMADIDACLGDGYSTAGSPGSGLGAVRRQSRAVEIFSRPGLGTTILARLGGQGPAGPPTGFDLGVVCIAKPGEEVCGDGWAWREDDGQATLMVADGLGHGAPAAAAAGEAVRVFHDRADTLPAGVLGAIHEALRATRGAAVAIARLDPRRGMVDYAGVGNISGTVVNGPGARQMVSLNGTVGHAIRRIQGFDYPVPGREAMVILHSDGLGTRWSLDDYPGLARHAPLLIASVLYRDFSRRRDDVTVAVLRATRS